MSPTRVCVGAISGAFGVRGEVRLKSFCATPEDIAAYGPLFSEDGTASYTVKLTAQVKNGFAAEIEGITSKEAADALRGLRLYADRDRMPALSDDEYYHADLIGIEVRDTGGTLLGHVKAVQDYGAGDMLEVTPAAGGATILLPFTHEAVPTVDIGAGRIVADPPEGLFG
ncbi:ribosome maturation factor RimM [Tropicimonas sp. IMCC34043]|uniref:ribosome maturation factor RimM n=1 Tax=Tropicimonas sp. IMCC34043 TaxID=2248760 RepID=UPI000E228A3B|nr:ribosome maturation factor RimM [Tropicimonas sp. IMCC34043]